MLNIIIGNRAQGERVGLGKMGQPPEPTLLELSQTDLCYSIDMTVMSDRMVELLSNKENKCGGRLYERNATFVFRCYNENLIEKFRKGDVPCLIISGDKYGTVTDDMLTDIFVRNKQFTDAVKPDIPQNEWLIKNGIAIMEEASEFMNALPWKWWGRGVDELDRGNAIEELIDLMHFMFAALDALECTPQDIYNEYVRKNKINWERQQKKTGFGVNNDG